MQRREDEGDVVDAFSQVAYTQSYHAELEPGPMRLLAALAGVAPPPAHDFAYCEIGSGAGVTLNALAAAHPEARFVGVDRSATHTAFAKARAAEAEIGNVEHFEMDAADLGALRGSFDFIALHGVWSWIAPSARAGIAAFARERLTPRGLFFASYNALPGWAAITPLRHALRAEAVRSAADDPLERARAAVAAMVALRDAGAAYFHQNPAAQAMLERLLQMDTRYVVHEFLLPDWHALASDDVAKELGAAGLHRIGQLPLWENVRELSIPAGALPLFGAPDDDVVAAESRKDFVVNRFFRRDVFTKGAPVLDPQASLVYFAETPFGAVTRDPPTSVELAHHTLTFSGDLCAGLLATLGRRAAPLQQIVADPALAGFPGEAVIETARTLLLTGVARPFATPVDPGEDDVEPASDEGTEARWVVDARHDRAALARAVSGQAEPVVLTSRAAGAGVVVSSADARTLAALIELPGAPALEGNLRDLTKLEIVRRSSLGSSR